MKNKAYEFKQMTEEERSMHLFYTIEGMVETLQIIGNELDTESSTGASRLALISDLEEKIEALYSRVHKDFVDNKTKNAVSYSI